MAMEFAVLDAMPAGRIYLCTDFVPPATGEVVDHQGLPGAASVAVVPTVGQVDAVPTALAECA
jgi:hypothetical protein